MSQFNDSFNMHRLVNTILYFVADIDECETNASNCHANAFCVDTIGSFNCSCQSGYVGDGTVCSKSLV